MRGKSWDLRKRYANSLSSGAADESRLLGKIQRKGGWDYARRMFDTATETFAARVLADGGAIEDIDFLDSFIDHAKANNYYNDITAAYSPSWGVKGTTTVSKLYSVIGAAQDLEQAVGANQPTINLADLNGKTRLTFDGVNDFLKSAAFPFVQPETFIFGGLQQVSWSSGDCFCDGISINNSFIQQHTASPQINAYSGVFVGLNSDLAVGADATLRVLFKEAAAKIQVDNNAETSGNCGPADSGGFTLGAAGNNALNSNIKTGTIILLDATVDGDYPGKVSAIYNFLKSAYGTP